MVDSTYFVKSNSSWGFQLFFSILCRHVTDILKMCIKNFIGENIIFDKFTAFFNLDIFQPSLIYNTAGSAYFMKSSPPCAFIVLFEFFAHLFQIYFRCA